MASLVSLFWETEEPAEEWLKGKLAILPKKGDLHDPNNYRGIMLLESFYKIVANIIHARLSPIINLLETETQCGFRPERSTIDAIFTTKMILKKRQEHGQESYVLFLDLVKAFDRVPRPLLWKVLLKYGIPPKTVRLITKLHTNISISFKIADTSKSLNNTIGVKQGDTLGPLLFIFYITAIIESWKKSTKTKPCIFRSSKFFNKPTGRSFKTQGDKNEFRDSAYADDTAVVFTSRQDTEIGVNELISHFQKFGMEIHTGSINKNSKSEILYVPALPHASINSNSNPPHFPQNPVVCPNNTFIPIVDAFKYLGSFLNSTLSDHKDVLARIEAASKAFGSLKKTIFKNIFIHRDVKVAVYRSLIIPILLYGSECWFLTSPNKSALVTFHNSCARQILNLTKKRQRENYISSQTILNTLKLPYIETLLYKHQLRYYGHIRRMNYNRLPRKLINSWLSKRRPHGSPRITQGRYMKSVLKEANISIQNWHKIANDRIQWKSLINKLHT